jgi:Amt family ammonium transporter
MDSGATAWLLASAALVLLMTPGVAFFYGGMVRGNNVLGILMQNFTAIAVVSLVWVLLGFSVAFGTGTAVFGDLSFAGLTDLSGSLDVAPTVPVAVFAVFQLMFAVLTPALITGATVERWRFGAFVPFVAVWSLLVYSPVAHWVFSPHGWAARWGALDFAGGAVVHVNAGAAALAMAALLGRRQGWPDRPARPHNLALVMLGTGMLWFGWFGFNAGSAYGAGQLSGTAMLNTQVAASAGLLAWIGTERLRYGKATALGAASGAVAGLVSVTPAAGYVNSLGALAIGVVAGVLCQLAAGLKMWFGVDDSLDVVAVHLVGGIIGSVCVGLLATRSVNPAGADGLFYGGGYKLLGVQVGTVLVVAAYSLVATLLIGAVIDRLVGNRVRAREEAAGLDLSQHGEAAYETVAGRAQVTSHRAAATAPAPGTR